MTAFDGEIRKKKHNMNSSCEQIVWKLNKLSWIKDGEDGSGGKLTDVTNEYNEMEDNVSSLNFEACIIQYTCNCTFMLGWRNNNGI